MKEKEFTKLLSNLRPNYEVPKPMDFIFNSPKKTAQKLTYYVRKANERDKSEGKINKQIETFFYSPDTYFSSASPVRLGKNPEITEITIDRKSTKNVIKKILNTSYYSRQFSAMTKPSKDRDRDKDKDKNGPKFDTTKFEIIDNKKLDSIFNSFRERINSQKSNSSYKYNNYNNLPANISLQLNDQQKKILDQKNKNKQDRYLLNYLSKKIHTNKKDLLMNKVDNYLYKKEIINKMENNNSFDETKDRFIWTTSLRNSDKLKGVRRTLVNMNTDKYPFWGFLVEKSPNYQQTSLRPGIDLKIKNLRNFVEKAKASSEVNKNNINNIKNLDDINIKGEDLFNIEYKREMSSKKKRILHKAFVENGKIVLNNDINNVFGKETFYKNYDYNDIYYPLQTSEKMKFFYTVSSDN